MFQDFHTDTIIIKKPSGEVVGTTKASVQRGKKAFFELKELVEPGDILFRQIGDNYEEYIIIEPGYHSQVHGIPAGYQATIERKNKIHSPSKTPIVNNHYNMNGNNNRVNNNSVDNSSNLVQQTSSVQEIINAISAAKSEIASSTLNAEDINASSKLLDLLEEKAPSEDKSLIKMLLNALPSIAKTMPSVVKLIELLSK